MDEHDDLNARIRSMILENGTSQDHHAGAGTCQVPSYQGSIKPKTTRQQGKDLTGTNSGLDVGTVQQPGSSASARGRGRGRGRGGFPGHFTQSDCYNNPRQDDLSFRGRSNPNNIQINPRGRGMPQSNLGGMSTHTRGGHTNRRARPSFFTPLHPPNPPAPAQIKAQALFLERLAEEELPKIEMTDEEFQSKDTFRKQAEIICREVMKSIYSSTPSLNLIAYGSLASGFAMPGSDLDLVLMTPSICEELPRLLEQAFLDRGYGARLLTRTRVPILKLCEKPTGDLYDALRAERKKWDDLDPKEKDEHDRGPSKKKDDGKVNMSDAPQKFLASSNPTAVAGGSAGPTEGESSVIDDTGMSKKIPRGQNKDVSRSKFQQNTPREPTDGYTNNPAKETRNSKTPANTLSFTSPEHLQYYQLLQAIDNVQYKDIEQWISQNPPPTGFDVNAALRSMPNRRAQRPERPWYREKPPGPLDFPKTSVGILCDINFSNPLGIHNTALLHAYSTCDVRVRVMVLFVKLWASRRKTNSGYNGTLSSYGYVLMVLHFLVNVTSPPVCPNLQLWETQKIEQTKVWPPQRLFFPADPSDPSQVCEGADIRFHRNEAELASLAQRGLLTRNKETIGELLRKFFEYYGARNGFNWTKDVLSLRSPNGLMTKAEKGWTGARTTAEEGGKEIRHRYLFAIEDPFEIDHNVGRTVTHNGIVAIRDEFRRCVRILDKVGRGEAHQEGNLLEVLTVEMAETDENEGQKT